MNQAESFKRTENLKKALGSKNPMALPQFKKVVVNIGAGLAKGNPTLTEQIIRDLRTITGQQPVPTKAKKAIAAFKIRKEDIVGFRVTLRGRRMEDFVKKLALVVLPQLRDFRGIDPKSFDRNFNLTLGFKDQLIFPEIAAQGSERPFGLGVTLTLKAKNQAEAQALLLSYGFPFLPEREALKLKG